jgi:hypothetical protein
MNFRIQEIKCRARVYSNTNNLINMFHLCLGKLLIPKIFVNGYQHLAKVVNTEVLTDFGCFGGGGLSQMHYHSRLLSI